MVDWKLPLEITRDAEAFDRTMLVVTGVYVWECIISLDFDFQFITRRRPFQWPMIFYFLTKYLRLFSIIGLIFGVNFTVTSESQCRSLYYFTLITGNAATGFSSITLSLRTMAVWGMERYIIVPITVIILGHLAILMSGPSYPPVFVVGESCSSADGIKPLLVAAWIYTMVFDFIVMVLMGAKLLRMFFGLRSRLADLIFRDGLIYFIIAFVTNLVAATLMLLDFNTVMFEFAVFPAAVIQSIVACRVVRRLTNFSSSGLEMFSTIGPLEFRSGRTQNVEQGPEVYSDHRITVNNDAVHSQRVIVSSVA